MHITWRVTVCSILLAVTTPDLVESAAQRSPGDVSEEYVSSIPAELFLQSQNVTPGAVTGRTARYAGLSAGTEDPAAVQRITDVQRAVGRLEDQVEDFSRDVGQLAQSIIYTVNGGKSAILSETAALRASQAETINALQSNLIYTVNGGKSSILSETTALRADHAQLSETIKALQYNLIYTVNSGKSAILSETAALREDHAQLKSEHAQLKSEHAQLSENHAQLASSLASFQNQTENELQSINTRLDDILTEITRPKPRCPAGATLGQDDTCRSCHPKSILHTDNMCYYLSSVSKNRNQAVRRCSRMGRGHLVTMTPANREFVYLLASTTDDGEAWIGLKRSGSSSPYEWDDETPYDAEDYNEFAPNTTPAENCVTAVTDTTEQWGDVVCNVNKPYICQSSPLSFVPET